MRRLSARKEAQKAKLQRDFRPTPDENAGLQALP
jgi:hypothetical protein